MGELEGAVADGDGRGDVRVVVVHRLRVRRRRALRRGLALPRRISPDDLRPGLTRQRRQRRAASDVIVTGIVPSVNYHFIRSK